LLTEETEATLGFVRNHGARCRLFYWSKTGRETMHGEINANLEKMPLANMVVLFSGFAVLLIITAIIVVFIVRKLGIKSFGPFKMEHNNTSVMYDMNEKIKDIDDLCHRQMRDITGRIKIHISNIFVEMNICIPIRVSISSIIRYPLYESISNNHFTTELMPERYPIYRERIIETMKDEYVSLATANKDEQCDRDKLPPWEKVSDLLISCIDLWLKRIAVEVMDSCERKVIIYKQHLRDFEESGDTFRAGICKECIEKNDRYIRELKRLI
jgi:hypothetical protein